MNCKNKALKDKNLKIKSLKGSILIYILLIFTFIFTILSLITYKLNRKLDYLSSRNETEDLYYLAVSGSEKLLDIFNQISKDDTIYTEITKSFRDKDIGLTGNYNIDDINNKYNGDFFIEKEIINNSFQGNIKSYFEQHYLYKSNKFSFTYDISFSHKEQYNVLVNWWLDKNDNYIFESISKNILSENTLYIDGEIKQSNDNFTALVKEKYKPNLGAYHFDFGMGCEGDVVYNLLETKISGSYSENYFLPNEINNDTFTDRIEYSEKNPLIVLNNGGYINLSDYEATSFILINNSNSTLNIHSSNETSNITGLIYSNGDINISSNLTFSGAMYSKNNINISSSSVNIFPVPNILYDIDISNDELKRKTFDFFAITNYNSIDSVTNNKINAEDTIITIKSIFFNNYNSFEIWKLRQRTGTS